ncbi:MAG TPA: type II toxin-antitoxin system HicA family toxin [Terriglobia bacterium]|nr:type II toxin-antitoxin system HicA family toxin [Terriglobia bacterium]
MSRWPSTKARKVFTALLRIGWSVKAGKGSSHLQLTHGIRGEFTWAFHDSDEIGPKMLARIAKHTGLKVEDL